MTSTPRTTTSATNGTTVTKVGSSAAIFALVLWISHGINTGEWTALPSSVGQLLIDSIPVMVGAAYTFIKHILRDRLGWNIQWLG